MSQYLSWLANAALFVLCCSLVADAANAVFAAMLTPEAARVEAAPNEPAAAARSWNDRRVILERNLFNASLLAPSGPIAEEIEDLEATQLPLTLVGTVVSDDPERTTATIVDRGENETLLLRVNDTFRNEVKVARIERTRVVILENGSPRELAFDEDESPPPASPRARLRARPSRRRASARPAPSQRIREVAENRYSVPRSDVREAASNPASLLSQARILPKYEEGEMVGLQINAIKPGSVFDKVGIEDGDVVREVNGIRIETPEDGSKIFGEFTDAEELTVVVSGPDGESRTLHFSVPDE